MIYKWKENNKLIQVANASNSANRIPTHQPHLISFKISTYPELISNILIDIYLQTLTKIMELIFLIQERSLMGGTHHSSEKEILIHIKIKGSPIGVHLMTILMAMMKKELTKKCRTSIKSWG